VATVPSPRTWAVGELLTAAKLNTDLRDGLSFLLSPPRALLHKTATQTFASSTWTTITWDSEQYDNDSGHSNVTNPSRYTVQTAGWWEFHAEMMFQTTAGGDRGGRFLKNATGNPIGEHMSGSATVINGVTIHAWALMSVGDYIESLGWQNSGATIGVLNTWNLSPNFLFAKWIGIN
jgi:hypothetical protein